MGTTTTWGLPYPVASDAPNGPVQLMALAEATDAALTKSLTLSAVTVAGYDAISPTTTNAVNWVKWTSFPINDAGLTTRATGSQLVTNQAGWYVFSFMWRLQGTCVQSAASNNSRVLLQDSTGTELLYDNIDRYATFSGVDCRHTDTVFFGLTAGCRIKLGLYPSASGWSEAPTLQAQMVHIQFTAADITAPVVTRSMLDEPTGIEGDEDAATEGE